jgi:phosphoribosylanthranilate isomerase
MKVKICGITNVEDALHAAELGADALGFIFVKSSPRYISPSKAQKIIRKLHPFIVPVGVFADSKHDDILEMIEQTGIGCVQLHGNESPKQLAQFPVPVYKAFRVDNNFNPEILRRYAGIAYLLDAFVEGAIGGTGKTFDWNIAVEAKTYGRIILAGGLKPENIAEAVQSVQPYAVDVNSGVESVPGKKDKLKLKQLFYNIQQLQNDQNKKEEMKK